MAKSFHIVLEVIVEDLPDDLFVEAHVDDPLAVPLSTINVTALKAMIEVGIEQDKEVIEEMILNDSNYYGVFKNIRLVSVTQVIK